MLIGLSFGVIAVLVLLGVGLDMRLGEATRWHPLVGFGNLAMRIEKRFNRGGNNRIGRGAIAWLVAVVPLTAATWLITYALALLNPGIALALHALILYFCLGLRSLRDHTMPIANALIDHDLPQARALTARIVSRDTSNAQESDLAKAAVESLLENGNDAVFGTLFWFVVAGAPGAVLFRLSNTLDAMWGYRTERFNEFGRVAARVDDALNFIPARLTALSYVILGNTKSAWQCWRSQAAAWSSPNAGPVMSAGAGALGVSLGGAAIYDGEVEQRPPLGIGPLATGADIARAWKLVKRTTILWLVVICIAGVAHA